MKQLEYYKAERQLDGSWRISIMRTTTTEPFGHNQPIIDPKIDEEVEDLGHFRKTRPGYMAMAIRNIHGRRPMRHRYRGEWLVI